ncbi:SDR family oxidoreductase [Mucilaginibacter robiniae]|uniref:SDR family oxidoreductase n=1 Tax=Mucilaginibacter robiniae TaxID=2728022 RepID=A0A7L5DZI0_9SPHI|nr:SDR family oxidoreductase [Mucilaginibacter robiniae]QJD95429.1 SDR family oxidoreductase [Mucilaginibacter robiniae]
MRFSNKVCLVTGGGSGIGKATCLRMAVEGGTVIVIDREEKSGIKTVDEITKKDGQAMFIRVDVGVTDEIEQCVKTVVEKYKKIDVLVNDAAMMTFQKIVDLSIADWDQVIDVNLRSVFAFCKYCLPYMKKGAVVNVSSVHAFQTEQTVLPYAASKGGIEAFTRGLSREYTHEQARFNCVAPGAVDTPMLWSNPEVKDGDEKITGQVGEPEDLAAAICFMASDEARFVNGTTLVVDGGRLAIL